MTRQAQRHPEYWLLAIVVVAGATVVGHNVIGRLSILVLIGVVCVRWSVRNLLLGFLTLSLALEDTTARPFRELWVSPVQHLGDMWFQNISTAIPGFPLRIAPLALVSTWLLFRVASARLGPRMERQPSPLPPRDEVRGALALVTIGILTWTAYGAVRNGSIQQAYYQSAGLFAMAALVAVASCVADAPVRRAISRIVVAVAVYRAGLVVYLYFTRVRELPEPPLFVTSHADSVLWATALCFMLSRLLEHPTMRTRLGFLFGGALMGFALVVNNRRLAWLIVLVGVLYVVFGAAGYSRSRLSSVMPVALPLALAYTVVGFVAPPARVFAPIQALKSMIVGDDSSTVTRKIENFNLVFTMRNNPPIGTGFGQPYIELVKADDISEFFAQYQYIPHNSVLGLMMWTGPLGLAIMLLPVLLAIRAASSVPTFTTDHRETSFAAMAFAACAGYLIQGWGDIGLQTPMCIALAGVLGGAAIAAETSLRSFRPSEPEVSSLGTKART